MSQKPPKLRGNAPSRNSLYPLGEFPDDVIVAIGRNIVHRLAVGQANITGDDFGEIFAKAISGTHLNKPMGVSDVIWNGCSWSAKIVQSKKPFEAKNVRLITGRNSPNYSYGIKDPFADVAATGEAVLNIWNARVTQSHDQHDDLRIVILVRNMDTLEFSIFETEAVRFVPGDYEWKVNAAENFQGYEKPTGAHRFTWQPHGGQFTVLRDVPGSAYKFRILKHVAPIEPSQVLQLVGFQDAWIERVT